MMAGLLNFGYTRMADALDIHVHTYAVARLAGIQPNEPVAVALRAILSRSFPPGEPPPVRARQRERAAERKQATGAGTTAPLPVPGRDFGFSTRAGALWIIRDALPDFRDMPRAWKTRATATMMFDGQHDLSNALCGFSERPNGFRAWCAGEFALRAHLQTIDRLFFKDLLDGADLSPDMITCRGMPTIATGEGLVWIGLTKCGGSNRDTTATDHSPAMPDESAPRRSTNVAEIAITSAAAVPEPISHETVNWNERLDALSDELGTRVHSVLQTIAALGMVNVPVSYAALREMSGLAVQDFDQLMTRLEADRWITAVPNPTESRDLDDRTVVLHPAPERAVRSSFRRSCPEGAILYGVLSNADEVQAVPPAMRAQLLSHPLTVALYETFERTPTRRLKLLLGALPAHVEERAECAVSLAPYDPTRALAAIDAYLTAYPDADYLLPACLKAAAEANQWAAFEAVWPAVAAQACTRSEEIIAHLTAETPPPLSRFATDFNDAVWQHPLGARHVGDLARLCRTAFEDDDQCWTLWLGLPIVPSEFLEAMDLSRLSPRLRACPWPPPGKK
jgi:hypothetical protein